MSSSNSRNFSFIILLGLVILATFTYIVVSNNLDDTITTDVNDVQVEE